jgi:hypothetical protein
MKINYWWWIKRRRAKQTPVVPGEGPAGDGIQQETADFLLAENGDFLIQE